MENIVLSFIEFSFAYASVHTCPDSGSDKRIKTPQSVQVKETCRKSLCEQLSRRE
jgi:hypothetical protein